MFGKRCHVRKALRPESREIDLAMRAKQGASWLRPSVTDIGILNESVPVSIGRVEEIHGVLQVRPALPDELQVARSTKIMARKHDIERSRIGSVEMHRTACGDLMEYLTIPVLMGLQ